MLVTGIGSRGARIGAFIVLAGALLAVSTVLAAVTADTAYAGGRQPNIFLTTDTKTKMVGTVELTLPPNSSATAVEAYTEHGQVRLGAKTYSADIKYYKSKAKVKNMKNTKPSVASITFSDQYPFNGKYINNYNFSIKPKKAGTTTISFKMQSGSVVKTCKFKVTVHKYDNALSTLKFGSANYAKKLNASDTGTVSVPKTQFKGKFTIAAAKGWKIQNATFWTYANMSDPHPQQTSKELKSGKSYTLKKGYIYVCARNTTDGRYRHFILNLKNPQTTSTVQTAAAQGESLSETSKLNAGSF